MSNTITIYDTTRVIQVGTVLWPDNWIMGTPLMASEFDGAAYMINSIRYPEITLAVNVTITGRTYQRRGGCGSNWVRCRIEFVNDGEPNTTHSGWLKADTLGWM